MISDEKLFNEIKEGAKKTVVRSFEYDDIIDGVARGVGHAKIGQLKAIEMMHRRSEQILERVFSDNNSGVNNQAPINIVFEKSDDLGKPRIDNKEDIPSETVGSVTE